MKPLWIRHTPIAPILPLVALLAVISCSDDSDPDLESACTGSIGPCAEGPAPPEEVVASLDDCDVRLTWSPVEGATHYRIYRDDESRALGCVPASTLEWFDPRPVNSFQQYRVATLNVDGPEACQEGALSAPAGPVVAGPCPWPAGFAYVPPGTFQMGTPSIDGALPGREALRTITLTRGFFLARHEVTQDEWVQVMGSNPSEFADAADLPVEQISWYDAIRYCNARSLREELEPCYEINYHDYGDASSSVAWNPDANGYRLPTEAEWEYACRAGSLTDLSNGDLRASGCRLDPNLDLIGWYCANSSYTTHPVMRKLPNAWGLYDMHGNVAEWCWDRHAPYGDEPVDPWGPESGRVGVYRGGSYKSEAHDCRSADRTFSFPLHNRSDFIGFRVARTVD